MHTRSRARWIQRYSGTVRLAEVDPARPVAVHLARQFTDGPSGRRAERFTLPVGDFDTSRPGGAERVKAESAHLARLAEACGIPAVTAISGPGGGRHVWMSCPEGVEPPTIARLARAAAALWPTFDGTPLFNPYAGAVRPPGAAHRHGGHAALHSHGLDEALALLRKGAPAMAFAELAEVIETLAIARERLPETGAAEDAAARRVPPSVRYDEHGRERPIVHPVGTDEAGRVRLKSPRTPLNTAAVRALRRELAEDEPHSEHAHHCLKHLAAAGYGYADAAELAGTAPGLEYLRTERAPGGRTERPQEARTALLARLWWLAVQDAARTPQRSEGREEGAYAALAESVADALDRIETAGPHRWARKSGPADLACLRAVLWLMLTSGSAAVSAPCRRLGVLMGYHCSTAAAAMARLVLDGWLRWESEPVGGTRTAGRLALADEHRCPVDDEFHECAVYVLADEDTGEISTAGQAGSDRRRNAAPRPPTASLTAGLRSLLTHHQGDVWHHLGHHAARTLEALQAGARTLSELSAATGYTLATSAAHVTALHQVGLARISIGSSGARIALTGRTLWSAAEQAGPTVPGRMARYAVAAIVDGYACDWWNAEVQWCRLSRADKRRRGRRAPASQQLIPLRPGTPLGVDPRAYPRHADGTADHARAHILAAARVGSSALYTRARQLARAGELIDPATLRQS
ncbi:hypothetical protein ABZ383_26445 [Streptomyces sp. NPDC005900]|uniref:hypothetical protein n=1 Tax=Streptomyces sp. NPDC005900 TaxID=3154569 RepID=UPI0033E60F6D